MWHLATCTQVHDFSTIIVAPLCMRYTSQKICYSSGNAHEWHVLSQHMLKLDNVSRQCKAAYQAPAKCGKY